MDFVRNITKRIPSPPPLPTLNDIQKHTSRLPPRLAFFKRRIRLKGNSTLSIPLSIVVLFPCIVIVLICVLFLRHPSSSGRLMVPAGTPPVIRKISERHDKVFSTGCQVPDTTQPRANATFVVLARNKELEGVIQSIKSVERHFNRWYHYPYVFLNDGDFNSTFKETIRNYTSSAVEFGKIDPSMWGYPDWADNEVAKEGIRQQGDKAIMYGGMESYHMMCRFYSGFFYKHELLQKYEWYWRVEPEIKYYCDITYDPFVKMIENNKTYGFTIAVKELRETVPNLFRYASAYKRTNNLTSNLWDMFVVQPEIPEDKKSKKEKKPSPKGVGEDAAVLPEIDPEAMEGESYNMCHFWSNFEIARLDWFRSKEYEDFFQMMDRSGGFWMERWGDAPIHSLAAGALLQTNEIHYFRDIGYRHTTIAHCPANAPARQLKREPFLEMTTIDERERKEEDDYWASPDPPQENGVGCRCRCDTDVPEVESKEGSCTPEWVHVAGGWTSPCLEAEAESNSASQSGIIEPSAVSCEQSFALNYPSLNIDSRLAPATEDSLMVHLESPHASRNDARMDETFEFLGRSAYLSSEDTDSTRDGSESLISFDDSAVDETSTQADPASHQDQASLDGDDSSDDSSIPEVVHTSLAQLEPQSDEPSAITTLSETQMFNSTLSTRTVTDSPIATDSENPENTLPGRKALLTGYKLDLTKPFHLLYHGPSSHRDIIIERIGQAIAASASTEIVTHEVTNSSRYCVMSVSFDDSHVALIPSTGLELIVTDAVGVCLFNQPKHRKVYTCQDQFDSLCPQGKTMPDLAVFLHHGSFDCVVKSSSCSTWMSELGVGVINLLEEPTKRTNMEDAIEVGLSLARDFEATKISERAEGFTTMTLNDFLDIDAASLNAEVASAVVLAAAKRPGKFSWMKPKAIKKHFNLLFSHFTDGCQWVADALNTGHSSLISASQSTLEHVKTRVPTELQFRIDLRRVAISMAIAACGFLMVHGLILGVLVTRFETRHHQYDPGFTTHLPSNTPPYVAAGCPAFTLAPNPELVSGKLSHLTSSKVLPEVESQIGSLLRQFSAHKTVASENLALQHVMLDNGTHLINLPSASFAGRKAPQVFVNATSSGKTVKVALNKLNSSSYELDLDLRAVKDLTRVLVWTHGTPSLNLNFTIHSNHSYQGLARLRRGFSLKSLLQSNTSKLIRYRSGKIVDSHFTVKPIVNNMKTFGHSAFMNLGKISKQLQDNANDLENSMAIPLMHGTARAVSTSKDALNKFGDNFARKTAKLAKDLKDIPKNVSPKLKGFSTVSSRPLYKAYAHARGFSKKLSSPKLSNAGIRETPKQVINSIKDLHGKMGARLTAFEKTMESKLDFINKGTAAIKKAIQEDGTRKSRIKSRVSGQKHGAHVESEKEATAGLKGFVARVVNMLPRH